MYCIGGTAHAAPLVLPLAVLGRANMYARGFGETKIKMWLRWEKKWFAAKGS